MISTRDDQGSAKTREQAKKRFATAQRMEAEYLRALRHLTRQIDHMVKGMVPKQGGGDPTRLQHMLRQYAQTITPWAESVAMKMLTRVALKDEDAWIQLGKTMGKALRAELNNAPTGAILQEFLATQVKLITSLPLDAAERVHTLTTEGMVKGRRASEIAVDILRTGSVTESRAKLIARTEVARTAAGLTMARASHVGCTHYIWRTSGDSDVRKSHKEMNGVVVPFDTMPTLSDGTQSHAGMIYNCRCFIDPIFVDE